MKDPFLTYRELDSGGRLCYYILQKAFPHYKGIISVGVLEEALSSCPVMGYNLYVNFSGCLQGNILPAYQDALKEINHVMFEMATWFLYKRVLIDEKKYNKFKNHVTSPTG